MIDIDKNKKDLEKMLNLIYLACAKLARQRYFTDELWTKVERFDHNDKADVQAAFISRYLYEQEGIPVCPAGLMWVGINEDGYLKEQERYEPIWQDYLKWCDTQR